MSLARAVLSRPGNVGSRAQGAVRPLLSAPRRSFVVYRPKWADNRAVMPDQWGTRIARYFTRMPEIAYGLIFLYIGLFFMWHKYYVQQVHPEFTYLVQDPYLDNPMMCNSAYYHHTELSKVITNMHGNRNMYHQVFREEDGVTAGAPWTDKRTDLYMKRFFSPGNQKMMLENKVDSYMANSKDGNPRLNISFGDYGMPGWTDSEGRNHKPSYNVPLPYNAPAPGTEIKYS
ncbi:unnamed protein product [Oikopleura dioica]|uniref:Uncharacterized protein n=1 Tax=Oikopleura dioica TaxID=34765 RepID=E4YS08_OIKDI|nr:unnamed protein product [Oikopleura dioica]